MGVGKQNGRGEFSDIGEFGGVCELGCENYLTEKWTMEPGSGSVSDEFVIVKQITEVIELGAVGNLWVGLYK